MSKLISHVRDLLEHPLWTERLGSLRAWWRSPGQKEALMTWASLVTLLLLLLLWQWSLGLALACGVGSMLLVYTLSGPAWGRVWQQYQVWAQERRGGWRGLGANGNLAIAVASGLLVTLGTYLTFAIWAGAQDHWLALGVIGQGLATLGILALLLVSRFQTFVSPPLDPTLVPLPPLEETLKSLADPEPVRRLVAIRQANQWLQGGASPEQWQFANDCLQVALIRENNPTVRAALRRMIATWPATIDLT